MRIRALLVCAVLACLAPACKTWAVKGKVTASIDAIKKVNRGEELAFTVHMADSSGKRIEGLAYEWSIDWVGLPGGRHKGKSGAQQTIRVKGQSGKATLFVRTYEGDSPVELAKQDFEVE